ncbi:MAG: sporulation protein YqfC [Sarcina sp.]
MGKINDLRVKIAESLEISEEVITNLPKISVIGKNKIIIENHKGIIEFDKHIVKTGSESGIIVITGKNFEVSFLGEDTIIVVGTFHSLTYGEEN